MIDYKLLVDTAILAGQLMLSSGAETYRVEDTMYHILHTGEAESVEALALMTGIMITVHAKGMEQPLSVMKTVNRRSTNLYKVIQVNDISRRYCEGGMTLEEAYQALHHLKKNHYSRLVYNLATAGVAVGFAMMFGGRWMDVTSTAVVGLMLAGMIMVSNMTHMNSIISDILSGVVIALTTLGIRQCVFPTADMDIIIVSTIMPIVPGVAITNAIRDVLYGDYLSGCARILEAFLKAASIALGVGVGMAVYSSLIGGSII